MATVSITFNVNASAWAEIPIIHDSADELQFTIANEGDVGTYDVDWGDGSPLDIGIGSGSGISHVFIAGSTTLKIRSSLGLASIKTFAAVTGVTKPLRVNGNISVIKSVFPNLKTLHITSFGTDLYTGSASDLPATLETLVLSANLSITTNELKAQCPNLSSFTYERGASASLTGALADLPSSLTYLSVNTGVNTVNLSGTINNIPKTILNFLLLKNTTNITGNIANLPPNIEQFLVYTNNTITGDLANIPASCIGFYVTSGVNNLFGNIANIQNASATIIIEGNNIVTGDIVNIPNTKVFQVSGNNTLSGFLSSVVFTPGNINIKILGNNTITYPSTNDFSTATTSIILEIKASASFIPSQVDQLINDLDSTVATKSIITLILTGPGAVRTAASDAAFTSITSGGGTITLTP